MGAVASLNLSPPKRSVKLSDACFGLLTSGKVSVLAWDHVVPFNSAGCGLVADGGGVGLPLSMRQLPHLHCEISDWRGSVAARDPRQHQAPGGHVPLGGHHLPGRCWSFCKQTRS